MVYWGLRVSSDPTDRYYETDTPTPSYLKTQFRRPFKLWIRVRSREEGKPQQFLVRATSKSSSFAYYVFVSF